MHNRVIDSGGRTIFQKLLFKGFIMSKVAKTLPSFDATAEGIIDAQRLADNAEQSRADTVRELMQKFVDTWFLTTGSRDQASCKAMYSAIVNSQVVIDACDGEGSMQIGTFKNYAGGAQRALHFNIEWTPTLFQNKERKLPWSKKPAADKAEGTKGSGTDPVKAGKVQTTTDKELIDTLRKAIQQARLLNRNMTVGLLIDAAQEIDGEFKE
jgi:hypothetical protein